MLFLDILGIGEWFKSIIIDLVASVYYIAAYTFRIFLVLADASIIKSIDYGNLLSNFYLIIGIVLLFFLAFSLLRGMVNPDDQKQGTSTIKKMVVNLVTSVIIMAILPTVFTFLYDFQNSILTGENNVIGKLFGYGSLDTENNSQNQNGANEFTVGANMIVNGVFTAFFNVNDAWCNSSDLLTCQQSIKGTPDSSQNSYTLNSAINHVDATGQFYLYSSFAKNWENSEINFSWFVALIAGCLLVYVSISFCFDMGIRFVKLVFYQIIAPIPIFFRVMPDGKFNGTFNKWVSITLKCYGEVFVRVFVVYLCVYLCNQLMGSVFINNLRAAGSSTWLFVKAFLLMGIVMFMKQAPKLISEATGLGTGDMKLGIRDKLKDGGFFTAVAALGAGATALTRNAVNAFGNKNNWKNKSGNVTVGSVLKNLGRGSASGVGGLVSGVVRGGYSGLGAKSFRDMRASAGKGAADAVAAREKREKFKAAIRDNGILDTIITPGWEAFKTYIGLEPNFDVLKEQKEAVDDISKTLKQIKSTSEDYIDKHKSEFYVGLSDDQIATVSHYRKMEKEGTAIEKATAASWLSAFDSAYSDKRLDVLESTIDAIKSGGRNVGETDQEYARRLADATNEYNRARKDIIDAFATNVGVSRNISIGGSTYEVVGHYGAEKEAAAINANLGTINDKLENYRSSAVVKTLRDGTDDGIVKSTTGDINNSNASKFIKQLKNATEVTDANINRQYEELQRKNSKKDKK